MITKAILLVGGKGTRLMPLTTTTPKPMLRIAGSPVTEHQIIKAREAGAGRGSAVGDGALGRGKYALNNPPPCGAGRPRQRIWGSREQAVGSRKIDPTA